MEMNNNEDLLINDSDYTSQELEIFNEMRKKTYNFPGSFFDSKLISTFLKYKVGDEEVKNMVLVENHFYKDTKIASFKFEFPFSAPNSINTWEYIYDVPKIKNEFIEELVAGNAVNTSDTFFFVDGILILHNKSEYQFYKDN